MDWKHFPEWVQFAAGFLILVLAVVVGTATKIATDVRRGDRHKFWSRQLWFDLPALFMMIALARGVATHYDLHPEVAGGLGAFFGYMGPRLVDVVLSVYLTRRPPEGKQ